MTVRKLSNGQYEMDIHYHHPLENKRKRFRKWTGHTSKRKAEQVEAEWRTKLTDRNYWLELEEEEANDKPLIRDFVEEYIERAASSMKPTSMQIYTSRLRNHLVPHLGDKRLHKVSTADVDLLFDRLQGQGLKVRTLEGIATAIGSMYSRAVRWGYLTKSQRPDIRVPSDGSAAEQEKTAFLTEEEFEALVEATHDRITTMLHVAVGTGMRVSELLGLMWNDCDFERKSITVARTATYDNGMQTPKGGKPRTLPMTERMEELLQAHRETAFSGEEFVFKVSANEPSHINDLRWWMDKAYKDAGLTDRDKKGWHVLRHTFAARLATKGVSLRLIQQLMGHSSVTVTERYAHLLPQSTEVARQHLSEIGL